MPVFTAPARDIHLRSFRHVRTKITTATMAMTNNTAIAASTNTSSLPPESISHHLPFLIILQ